MDGELRSVPEPLVYEGRNYLLKILTDLSCIMSMDTSFPGAQLMQRTTRSTL